jgi:tRNA (cmo5U34)-methyltransferase
MASNNAHLTPNNDYAEKAARLVPGYHDLHKMVGVLLAEHVPPSAEGKVLVLGAGGGQEIHALAGMYPTWRFDGVDPSAEMLAIARTVLVPVLSDRIHLYQGYIDTAPGVVGPYDAATCLLTLHFLPRTERLRTIKAVYERLQPGAPFVVAHHSFPQTNDDGIQKDRWLDRNTAYAVASGTPVAQAERGRLSFKELLPALSPEEDVALLEQAGFIDIELFYAALTFKGWVARKPTR